MDMIRTLRSLLEPVIAPTAFILTEMNPVDAGQGRRFGFLEYRAALGDGRRVLLGFYQFSRWRTVTVEMWVPEDARRMPPHASIDTVAMHRQVWSYDLLTDGDVLAREIVAEVATWLRSFGTATEPDSDTLSS